MLSNPFQSVLDWRSSDSSTEYTDMYYPEIVSLGKFARESSLLVPWSDRKNGTAPRSIYFNFQSSRLWN